MSQTDPSDHQLGPETENVSPLVTADDIHKHFHPYRRISPPWNLYERIKTVLVVIFILPFRLLYFALCGLTMLLFASIAVIGLKPSHASEQPPKSENEAGLNYDEDTLFQPPPRWRKFFLSLLFPLARSMLFISFGVYNIKKSKKSFSQKPQPDESAKAYVIVANHLGYIDILVLFSMFKASFVAKGDLERTPIIGTFARALQCMFVRKGQSLTTQLINRVKSTHECHAARRSCPGCPSCQMKLVIFPEGTTTNGTAMVPFRSGVFNAGVPVKPVCIVFPHRHFNMSWETIRFREHLFRTMTQIVNYVELTELPVYSPSEKEKMDARLYASSVQKEMAIVLEQPIIPLNRKHKFLYHSYILGKEESEREVLRKAETLFDQDDQLQYVTERNMAEEIV